jgi:hypothetical protein
MRTRLFLLAFLAANCMQSALPQQAPVVLEIGTDRQLFVDDYLIDSLDGATLKLQSPEFRGVAIRFDQPWEGNVSAYVSVFRANGKYRMYYRGASAADYARPSALRPGERVLPPHPDLTCYAESDDGISWTKPTLGLVEFNGSKANNIILKDSEVSENFSPFYDKNPAAPESARFKAVGGGSHGLYAFESGDGIHWKKILPVPVLTDGTFDSLNVVFWDTRSQQYIAIYRDFLQGVRTFKRATSKDFLHWSQGEWADFGTAPLEQLYTSAATPYDRAPQIIVAFPKRYIPWLHPFADDPQHDGVSESVFMTSRDALHWDRRFLEAFVRPGQDPLNWVHRNNMIATGILETAPDEMSLFISRHYTFPSAYLERITLRTDGFVSVHAGYRGGSLMTKPLYIRGNELVLNYSTSAAGSIQWEIVDINNNPLPGFSFDQTQSLSGDEVERVIRLQKKQQTGSRGLDARPVRLHFLLKDADLYSLQIRN